jgi:hypothetical protein
MIRAFLSNCLKYKSPTTMGSSMEYADIFERTSDIKKIFPKAV